MQRVGQLEASLLRLRLAPALLGVGLISELSNSATFPLAGASHGDLLAHLAKSIITFTLSGALDYMHETIVCRDTALREDVISCYIAELC